MNGTVKFYNRTKRFGFVTADDGKEYFFHESGLEPGTNVKDEDKVSFEVVDGDRGQKAEKIKLLGSAAKTEDSEESTEAAEESEDVEETEEAAEEETSDEDTEDDSEDDTEEE